MFIATGPSCCPKTLAMVPTNNWFVVACVGLLGSAIAFSESRKLLQPLGTASATIPANAAYFEIRIREFSRLAVEAHRDDERPGEREVEVIGRADLFERAGDVGLRIETLVLGPRLQVATGDTHRHRVQ